MAFKLKLEVFTEYGFFFGKERIPCEWCARDATRHGGPRGAPSI